MEDRLVMSADLGAAIQIDYLVEAEVEAAVSTQATSLAAANAMTGQTAVTNTYGFTGAGQTVVVIDSGIAYNHSALGGGFGANYKVVGGWDFAENDWNPYDDGPMGSHGTHVAGIIGAQNGSNSGVATGADIVSLRVFDDNGAGYFSWVEQALQWVHTHRNSFANPITTVNLSLGAEWNSNTIPNWATLENEFAQLEADGIFISVAAGNSFTSYNSQGLSYPAASSYVVPVSAVDANGNLAYFSQRNSRVIAAPGVSITSTVPDYVGNLNGQADDWASYSGTSMAAPYLAGASMLIREAMQFSGWSNITQDDIYNVMYNTADWVYDSITASSYARLNLQSAINSIMGVDDYGSTVGAAHNLGTLSNTKNLTGTIGTLSDVDYFRFTSFSSGSVTISGNFGNMTPDWILSGGGGTVSADGKSFTFNVQQGQTYTFGLAGNKLGNYSLSVTPSSLGFNWTSLGAITQSTLAGQNHASGDTWYNFTATRTGTLTVEALFAQAAGNVDIRLYDANLNLIASSTSLTDGERVDIQALAGQAFFLKCSGANGDVGLRITNLIRQSGTNVDVQGTSGADKILLEAGSGSFKLNLNGVDYSFTNSGALRFDINSGAGADEVIVVGGTVNESGSLRVGELDLYGAGSYSYTTFVRNAEDIAVYGNGGIDSINMYDSNGNDTLRAYSTAVTLSGSGYSNAARGFRQVNTYASGGNDIAYLHGTNGNDTLVASLANATLYGSGYCIAAAGFDRVDVYGFAGNDTATLHGSAGNDLYVGRPTSSELTGGGSTVSVNDFARVNVYGNGGNDSALVHGSTGDDIFYCYPTYGAIYGTGFHNYFEGFHTISAHGGGGVDHATFMDSNGNDTFVATPTSAKLTGPGFNNSASGFYRYNAYSRRGIDTSRMYDSAGNDIMYNINSYNVMYGTGFYHYAKNFAQNEAYASTGEDRAYLYGTGAADTFISRPNYSQLIGPGYSQLASNFDRVSGYGRGGTDQAFFHDSRYNDSFYSTGDYAAMFAAGSINYGWGFRQVTAYASVGTDRAYLYDTAQKDTFTMAAAIASMQNSDYYVSARGFDSAYAYSLAGGNDTLSSSSIDFYFAKFGAL